MRIFEGGRTTTLQSAQSAVLREWTRICSKCSGNGASDAIPINQPNGEHLEMDHLNPKSFGGTDLYVNLQLLHRHCHDQKTATDGSGAARRGSDDNSQTVEEPDEAISLTSGSEAERRGRPRRLG